MNQLEIFQQANKKILSDLQHKFEPSLKSNVICILFSDFIDKIDSILVLKKNEIDTGVNIIFRSMIETYLYFKYILVDSTKLEVRAEAFYIFLALNEIKCITLNYLGNERVKKVPEYFGGYSIEYSSDKLENLISRYNELNGMDMEGIDSKVEEFYYNNNDSKKIKTIKDLANDLNQSLLYEVAYRLCSLETHAKSKKDTSKIISDHIPEYIFRLLEDMLIMINHEFEGLCEEYIEIYKK